MEGLICLLVTGLFAYLILSWLLKPGEQTCEMDAKIKELYNKRYCRFEYGEVLTTHSFKLIQVTETLFKLYVCDDMFTVEVFHYDQHGELLDWEVQRYTKPDAAPRLNGEPADFEPRESR